MIPTLTTERMTLGPFDMGHYKAFRDFAETARSKFVGGPTSDPRDPWDSCMIHLGQWIARGYGGFFATETATGRPCGRFSLWHPINFDRPELSWVVYADFEGQGFACEGAKALRDWAKTRDLGTLHSHIAPANTRSVALAQRLGCHITDRSQTPAGLPYDIWRHPA